MQRESSIKSFLFSHVNMWSSNMPVCGFDWRDFSAQQTDLIRLQRRLSAKGEK